MQFQLIIGNVLFIGNLLSLAEVLSGDDIDIVFDTITVLPHVQDSMLTTSLSASKVIIFWCNL